MADMTPTRLKRISKVPNRFSSEQSRIKTTGSPGETIIDYNSNTVSTTRNLTPANKPIKLKTPTNEPFKIKLPVKRPLLSLASTTPKESKSKPSAKGQSKQASKSSLSSPSSSQPPSSSTSASSTSNSRISNTPVIQKNNNNYDNNSKSILKKSSGTTMLAKPTSQQQQTAKFIEPKLVTENVFPTPPSSQGSPPNNSSNNMISPASVSSNSSSSSSSCTPSNCKPAPPIKIDNSEADFKRKQQESLKKDSVSSKIDNHQSQDEKPLNHNESSDDSEAMQITINDDNCIRCPCGVNDDLGVMVECEKCHFWQHGHCINIANEEDAFDGYLCPHCVLPKDRVQESLQMLNHNDEYLARFEALKSQIETGSIQLGDLSTQFTLSELYRAAMDINRIVRSLMAKWKLYQTNYTPDIRIYQNPIWGHDATKSPRSSNLYFVDNCKANLKTNIITMATKLETRMELLEHQFKPLNKREQVGDKDQIMIDRISRIIRNLRNELSNVKANLPELQS